MPTLVLHLTPPRSPEQCAALAGQLTLLTAQTLGKRAAVTAVVVHNVPPGGWFIGGIAVQGATALLEISITAGTNSADQKAAFVHAAHAVLRQALGGEGFEEASYVVVRELPAGDWGYDGQTQAARRPQAK